LAISSPYNPIHITHVGFNQETGEFIGLPKEWQIMLQHSGITEQEQKAHPQAVLDAIHFYQDSAKKSKNDAMWEKFNAVRGQTTVYPDVDKPRLPPPPPPPPPPHTEKKVSRIQTHHSPSVPSGASSVSIYLFNLNSILISLFSHHVGYFYSFFI
jgi:hypothetical protein